MIRRALLLKVVSWIVFSPSLAFAQDLACRADVRATMERAWMATDNGNSNFEAAFFVLDNGDIRYLGVSREYMTMHLGVIPPGTIAVFHTHPNAGISELSPQDKTVADHYGLAIYAITVQGLYKYSHPMGEHLVRPDMDWEKPCKSE